MPATLRRPTVARRRRSALFAAAAAGAALSAASARGDSTWTGGGSSSFLDVATNWAGNVAPASKGTTALVFAAAAPARANPTDQTGYNVTSLAFNSGAASFTLGGTSGQSMILGAGGVNDAAANVQTITEPLILSADQSWAVSNAAGLLNAFGGVSANGNRLTVNATGSGGLTSAGPGTLTLAGANTYTGDTVVFAGTLEVAKTGRLAGRLAGGLVVGGGGAVVFDAAPAAAAGPLLITAGPARVGGGSVALAPATSAARRTLLVAPSVAISGPGTIDVANNGLDLTGTTVSAVTDLAAAGFNGGAWNGPGGLVSSAAAAAPDVARLTAVGVIQNATAIGGTTPIYLSFDGQPVTAADVLARYSYYGDANLDGVVNAADHTRLDAGAVMHLTGWQNGDFNYDGVVDGSDYALADNAFNQQAGGVGAPTAVLATPAAVLAGPVATVPEPGSLGLLTAGGTLVARGRRRRA